MGEGFRMLWGTRYTVLRISMSVTDTAELVDGT